MKKQLLLGSALLAAISAFPQNARQKQSASPFDMGSRLAEKYAIASTAYERAPGAGQTIKQPIGPQMPQGKSSAATTWNAISGSMNIYGMLVSNSKPLQYHPGLNAVSFIHRKSFTYVPSPVATPSGAATGVLVAHIAGNMTSAISLSWDSTCIWNSNTNWARYPQGAIYSAPGNTSIASAYAVATGPITQANSALGWIGNYFTSKSLSSYDNVASSTPNAQQFIANTAPFGNLGKADFVRTDLCIPNDGMVRAMGEIMINANGTSAATQGFRGARIANGIISAGVFAWSGDSIIPNFLPQSGGGYYAITLPHMCWNEAGTTGYVWFIGCLNGATGANSGYQPIVYKTTNSGSTWTQIPGINFNLPGYQSAVMDHLFAVNNSTLAIPFFNVSEGVDGVVDANDQLHIVTTLISTYSSHPDTLGFSYNFTNPDGERYSYLHGPGSRPYIYDFYTSATSNTNTGSWNVMMVDSMSSEAPGETSTRPGYAANPWDAAGGSSGTDKLSSDARIQLSRTPDGQNIICTWAESDTAFTASSQKWNNIPNIKARLIQVNGYSVHPCEINVTNPTSGANVLVASNAQMFYASPRCALTSTTATSINFREPLSVSNNQNVPLTQLLPNTHWYSTAELSFTVAGVGIAENAQNSVSQSVIYPNPANGNANLLIYVKDNSTVDMQVINLVGDVVKTVSAPAAEGQNNIAIDLDGLTRGIYFVNVKVGNSVSSKKLIIE